jgi:6-O-methylguanine DNA methyltransferase, DNA binding domain
MEAVMIMQTLEAGKPETLHFGYGDTAPGTIVVAESICGVVALFIGDDREKLLRDLKGAFPEAEFVHRVVKSDGSISGYRWGVQRKRRLINMEGMA